MPKFDDRDLIVMLLVAVLTGVVIVLTNDDEEVLDVVFVASALYAMYQIGRRSP